MGLLSIFQRKKQTAAKSAKSGRPARQAARQAPAAAPADSADAVRDARARARRRLMGATVLLLVGVIGFPLLFETQPRPIPVDIPIDIPSRNGTVAIDAPSPQAASPRTAASATSHGAVVAPASSTHVTAPVAAAPLPPSAGQVGERPSSFAPLAGALAASGAHNAGPATAAAKPAHVVPPPTAAATTAPARTGTGTPATASSSSGEAAAALLAGKSPDTATEGGRYVVQIGAYADDAKMHEARGKVEKLGLKTYTQSVDTPSGKRVRVRVGPYPSKAEADKAASRIKSDGLPAAVLAL